MPCCAAYGSLPAAPAAVTSFVTNPKSNRVVKLCSSAKGTDAIVKMAAAVVGSAEAIVSPMDSVADTTKTGLRNTSSALSDTRMTIALLNIFRGIIGAAYQQAMTISRLVKGIFSGNRVDLANNPVKHNDVAVNKKEKFCALAANTGRFVSSMGYIAGFGICRPCAFTEKRFGELGETSSAIGRAFPTVMMVNHIGAFIGNLFEMIYQKLACTRASNSSGADRLDEIEQSYGEKMIAAFTGLVTKILELAGDIVFHLHLVAPIYVKVPLALSIGGLSLYSAWRDTA